MADFEIIEADFQQFYHLDVSSIGFRRYARLLLQLPPEARLVQKYSPFKDWSWDREMQAQLLHSIDIFATMYANANRKKGTKKAKTPELVQPDYVKKAKLEAKKQRRETSMEEKEDLARFFEQKNNKAKKLGETKDGA